MLYEHETRTIFHSSLATVVDFRCPSVETNTEIGDFVPDIAFLCFPRRGAFHKLTGGGEPVFGDPNHVLFFNESEPFRISYPLPGGDDSTFFAVDRGLLREILERYDPAAADDGEVTFPYESGLSDSRTFLIHRLLFERWSEGTLDDPVAAEEGIVELVSRARS